MEQNTPTPTQVHIPAFMTQAGYEKALTESIASRDYWIRLGERMKKQQEEQEEEWKRKDVIYAKAMRETTVAIESQELQEKIQRDHAEIKKYSQQEIDEAVRQIRIERLKNLLNPYVY